MYSSDRFNIEFGCGLCLPLGPCELFCYRIRLNAEAYEKVGPIGVYEPPKADSRPKYILPSWIPQAVQKPGPGLPLSDRPLPEWVINFCVCGGFIRFDEFHSEAVCEACGLIDEVEPIEINDRPKLLHASRRNRGLKKELKISYIDQKIDHITSSINSDLISEKKGDTKYLKMMGWGV